MQFQPNERAGGAAPPPLEEIQRRVMRFLREEAGFAQVFTINRAGFPVGRTMVAPINDDWSVDLIQRKVHKRLAHWRRRPQTEIVWVGPPHRSNRNLRPHVYDWQVQVPRVVFLRGIAHFLSDEELVERFERQTAINLAEGRTLAPVRDRANIVAELIGVHIQPLQVRAEGFAGGPESYTWEVR
ncbi:MAG: hypothetical protein RMM58_15595 [Chloroflexota bacterium]|nr:hypothetical protein [Dehalococcoidia bacterium]MDW8255295.1 hypothetical protein [Chloroflexota bacterium]